VFFQVGGASKSDAVSNWFFFYRFRRSVCVCTRARACVYILYKIFRTGCKRLLLWLNSGVRKSSVEFCKDEYAGFFLVLLLLGFVIFLSVDPIDQSRIVSVRHIFCFYFLHKHLLYPIAQSALPRLFST